MNRNIINPDLAHPAGPRAAVGNDHANIEAAEDNHLFRAFPRRLHETREILSAVVNLCCTIAKFATTAILLYASFRTTVFLNAHPLASTLIITTVLLTIPTVISGIITALGELSHLKAQNKDLKTENASLLAKNADLRAENEHIRQELRDRGLELPDEAEPSSDSDHQSESDTGSDED